MEVRDVTMDFQYGDSFTVDSPEAYERLILDVLLGDPPLFPRHTGGREVLGDLGSDSGSLGQAGAARALHLWRLGAARVPTR